MMNGSRYFFVGLMGRFLRHKNGTGFPPAKQGNLLPGGSSRSASLRFRRRFGQEWMRGTIAAASQRDGVGEASASVSAAALRRARAASRAGEARSGGAARERSRPRELRAWD